MAAHQGKIFILLILLNVQSAQAVTPETLFP